MGFVLWMDCDHGMWYLGQSYYAVWYLEQIGTTWCGTWDGLLLRGVVRGTDCYEGCGIWDSGVYVYHSTSSESYV